MKIAVCIFGQPRFYREAAESFRREFFDFPGHDVDVFIHAWDETGYTPEDDLDQTNQKSNPEELSNELYDLYKAKRVTVESPHENFNKIAKSLFTVLSTVRDEKWHQECDWRNYFGKKAIKTSGPDDTDMTTIRIGYEEVLRYEMGQFYSISKVIESKAWYEKQNNFEYDLVVRVRTDAFYLPEEFYLNKEEYYQEKERYYSYTHENCNGVGIFGHGLKLVGGFGNGAHDPRGNKTSEIMSYLKHICFTNGSIEKIAPTDKKAALYPDALLDNNGMFAFPWKLHMKDWIMYSDSDTANRVWGGMLSSYITIASNDIVRFMGGKQVGHMPGGEVLNGLAIMLNNGHAYQGEDCPLRLFKVVHRDPHKRKRIFINKEDRTNLKVMKTRSVPVGTHDDMKERVCDWAKNKKLFRFRGD